MKRFIGRICELWRRFRAVRRETLRYLALKRARDATRKESEEWVDMQW